jgi:hypothetical protein
MKLLAVYQALHNFNVFSYQLNFLSDCRELKVKAAKCVKSPGELSKGMMN